MLKTFPLSDTGEMDKKKTDQLIDSIDAPTGMTITIGQIYSAYVNQLQRRVNLYATAFFKTVTDQILVATRPIGSTDRLLYMPDELGPPDASKEKLPPSGREYVEDLLHGCIGHAVTRAEISLYIPPSDFSSLPSPGVPSVTPEKKPKFDVSSSLPSTSRAVKRPKNVEEIVEGIEETRKKELILVKQFLMEELRRLDSDVATFAKEHCQIANRDRFYEHICEETMNRAMAFIPVGEALHSRSRATLRDILLKVHSAYTP